MCKTLILCFPPFFHLQKLEYASLCAFICLKKLWHLIPPFFQYNALFCTTSIIKCSSSSQKRNWQLFDKTDFYSALYSWGMPSQKLEVPKVQWLKVAKHRQPNNQQTGPIPLLKASELFSCLAKILTFIFSALSNDHFEVIFWGPKHCMHSVTPCCPSQSVRNYPHTHAHAFYIHADFRAIRLKFSHQQNTCKCLNINGQPKVHVVLVFLAAVISEIS